MANTFKFGNGQWAVGKETALAYNDENSNFKPLPFTFDRASTATVVNKDGLIETVGVDEPRIDFLNNTKGHLLLEPSRTNLITNSNNLSTWGGSGMTRTFVDDLINPSNVLGGSKLLQTSSGGYAWLSRTFTGNETFSAFVKKDSSDFARLYASGNSVYFDIVNGTIQTETGSDITDKSIINYGNGWFRISISVNSTSASYVRIYPASSGSSSSGTNSLFVYGAQLEQGSYATSYIPTSGSTATRSADVCNNAGNSNVFNDSEGVLYFEVKALNSNVGTNRKIVLGDGSYNNGIEFGYQTTNNKMQFIIRSSTGGVGVTMNIETTAFDVTEFNKIAISYKSNEGKVFVNGSQVGTTDTSVTTPTGIDQLDLKFSTGFDFNSIVKDLKVYNTALSDSELQQLTS
jgi:hypothetical protein